MAAINRIIPQLRTLSHKPGLWSGCPPHTGKVDDELRWMLDRGYVCWRGSHPNAGYAITTKGVKVIEAFDQANVEA